ncbi:ERI1 exoribonuclease 2 [Nerophis ophidion]|uniref:ERI1 exoribonuclease 2 n=1 Tax=Nerophis ophidion TaxID=159077 RepID=UPI002AE02A19|nr:ERI1 exoribonuclease 2 [Nerophis ophidion]
MSTKKLAKELGLLRQRSQTSIGLKKTLLSNQVFSYLIVIDFESTCWREKKNSSQEIIEFPAVLLNTSTGEIESEFHTYVQPQEHPILSTFCTELTGITQMQVEAGVPLQICLSQFNRWLQKLRLEKGVVFPAHQQTSSSLPPSQKLCAFLTWSDWDLGVCLHYECKRKQIHKPDVVNSWIDLRSTYRIFYSRKPKGLNGALQDLGIQFCGREHSGVDDARNTAHLAARMMRDGCVMKITRRLERTPSALRNKTEANRPTFSTMSSVANATKVLNPEDKSSPKVSVPVCQSLVSPKTLLNDTTSPPWAPRSSRTRCSTAAHVSSPHLNTDLLLCSTVLGGLQQHQDTRPGPGLAGRDEEQVEELAAEDEDRCGSYDDVALDDVGLDSTEEGSLELVSDYDSGCYVWWDPEEPPTDPVPLGGEAGHVSGGPHAGFAVPQTLPKRHLHQAAALTKTMKTPSLFQSKTFIPEGTSTPIAAIFRPKKGMAPSFTVLADPVTRVATPGSRNVAKTVLSSLSINVPRGGKMTSPLCDCGRRSRRLRVSNGGPNQGRGFYCCAVRRSAQKGCEFFKWEAATSVSLRLTDKTLGPRLPQRKSC